MPSPKMKENFVNAPQILSYNGEQLVEYLDRNRRGDGYEISDLVGVENLSKSQRNELGAKLRAAAEQLEIAEQSNSLNINDLQARLTSVADAQNGARSPSHKPLSPAASLTSTQIAEAPDDSKVSPMDMACYGLLIEDGGQPVCSIEHLNHILAEPTANHEAIMPWLGSHPETRHAWGRKRVFFENQLTRWWQFRKVQWINRGLDYMAEGFPTFVEVQRSMWQGAGEFRFVSSSEFEEMSRTYWTRMRASRQIPDGQGYPAYSQAVQRRLAQHHFMRPLALKKNPKQQTKWTNWLEYVNFEQWWLEELTAIAETWREDHYYQPWQKLLVAQGDPEGEGTRSNGITITSSMVSSDGTPPPKKGPLAIHHLVGELEEAEAKLAETKKMIGDFIDDTRPYRRKETAVFHQRLRVKWAVDTARSLEAELSAEHKAAKKDKTTATIKDKKRRRSQGDEGQKDPEPLRKRTRGTGDGRNAILETESGKPAARRSRRLADLNNKTSLRGGVK